jgi:hypothetical protein
MKAKLIILLLFVSIFGMVASAVMSVMWFKALPDVVAVKEVSKALSPFIVGYVISGVSLVTCMILSARGQQMTRGTKNLGVIMTWINSLNAFPFGLLAAFWMQNRVWKKALVTPNLR